MTPELTSLLVTLCAFFTVYALIDLGRIAFVPYKLRTPESNVSLLINVAFFGYIAYTLARHLGYL